MNFFNIVIPPLHLFSIFFVQVKKNKTANGKKLEHLYFPFLFSGLIFVFIHNILETSGLFVSCLVMNIKKVEFF